MRFVCVVTLAAVEKRGLQVNLSCCFSGHRFSHKSMSFTVVHAWGVFTVVRGVWIRCARVCSSSGLERAAFPSCKLCKLLSDICVILSLSQAQTHMHISIQLYFVYTGCNLVSLNPALTMCTNYSRDGVTWINGNAYKMEKCHFVVLSYLWKFELWSRWLWQGWSHSGETWLFQPSQNCGAMQLTNRPRAHEGQV